MDSIMLVNILHNLTELEKSYLEQIDELTEFRYYKTYTDYLENCFIKEHKLAQFYWVQISDPSIQIPLTVTDTLDESLMLLKHIDISVAKQINFPVDFFQKCNYFDILYIFKGKAVLHWNDTSFHLTEGDLFFIVPGVRYRTDADIDSICLHIMIRRKYIVENFQNYFKNNLKLRTFFEKVFTFPEQHQYLLFHTISNESISDIIIKMFIEYINNDKFVNGFLHNYLTLLFLSIERYSSLDVEISFEVSTAEVNYHNFVDYLNENYRTATLTSLAEYCNFSKQYVCRIIRKVDGGTFSELLNKIRIESVKNYLTGTSLTLEVIAELTGFFDASSLSRTFKKICGISPSTYRKTFA